MLRTADLKDWVDDDQEQSAVTGLVDRPFETSFGDENYLSPTITHIVNSGFDFSALNKELGKRGAQISDGYGPFKGKTFRIGHMGDLTLERSLGCNIVVSASYLYSKGKKLPLFIDTNLPAASAQTVTYLLGAENLGTYPLYRGARPDTTLGRNIEVRPDVESQYHGMVLQIQKRFSGGGKLYSLIPPSAGPRVTPAGNGVGVACAAAPAARSNTATSAGRKLIA